MRGTRKARAVALAITVGVASFTGSARGQTHCPAIDGGGAALTTVDADARLAFVRATMHDQASRAKTWTWAWTGIGLGLAAGQFGLAPFYPANQRFQQVVEGVATLEIPGAIAVQPLRVRADDEVLESFLAATDVNGHGMETCLRLDRAEELLKLSAEDEKLHTNWVQHTLAIALGAGYGVLLQLIWKNWGQTILNGGGGIVLGEAQLLTLPTGAAKSLEKYRRGEVDGAAPAQAPKVSWTVAPMTAAPGVSLVGSF